MNWVQAFARQAASDMAVRDLLAQERSLPACHALQHLQMACEKICKASLINGGADPLQIQSSHAYISKQLPIMVKQYLDREAGRLPRDSWMVGAVRSLARKIELLNPSVRDGGRSPQNCEYPWKLPNGSIIAPADHKFEFGALFEPAGAALLKFVRQAAEQLQG